MPSAGFRPALQETHPTKSFHSSEPSHGVLAFDRIDPHPPRSKLPYRLLDRPRLGSLAVHDREVLFLDLAFLEREREPAMRLGALREDQDPARAAVEPMDDEELAPRGGLE